MSAPEKYSLLSWLWHISIYVLKFSRVFELGVAVIRITTLVARNQFGCMWNARNWRFFIRQIREFYGIPIFFTDCANLFFVAKFISFPIINPFFNTSFLNIFTTRNPVDYFVYGFVVLCAWCNCSFVSRTLFHKRYRVLEETLFHHPVPGLKKNFGLMFGNGERVTLITVL